tara:strand:+ start:296 stop:691 length:396 start_codon:yes stop_codon:yes gene_type:complete
MTSHFKDSHNKIEWKYQVIDDKGKKLPLQFTQDEILSLKKLIHEVYPSFVRKDGLLKLRLKVCSFYHIAVEEFLSRRRNKHLINARTDFCLLTQQLNTFPTSHMIGRYMNRNHATVLHHLKKEPVNLQYIL